MTSESRHHERADGRGRLGDYPLMRALLERRSRRFSPGMAIPDGPLAHRSDLPPQPLTEEEQAILVVAACGITGAALADWDYGQDRGGEMITQTSGRTVASADAVHTASLVVIDDEATWLARRPQDLAPEQLAEVIELTRAEQFVDAWRAMRVKLADGRVAPPTEPPYNIVPNQWSLYAEGTTFFLPVSSTTHVAINAMLEFLSERSGFFLLDDRRMFLPAGITGFAKSAGGHLDDDPRKGKAMPLSLFERMGVEMAAVEQGMILQNLGLACQAMGLSGFPVFAAHEESWFEALGFRMQEMPLTEYASVPFPASTLLKVTGRNPTMRYPVGLERDGEVLLESHAPPYYPSMEAAVHAVIEDKHGAGGIYGGGEPGVHAHREPESGWRDPDEVGRRTSRPTQRAVDATVAAAEYVFDRYGRFPSAVPPFHTLMGFQAGHVDEGFYEEHYRPGSLSESHRAHDRRWHGEE